MHYLRNLGKLIHGDIRSKLAVYPVNKLGIGLSFLEASCQPCDKVAGAGIVV